MLKEVQHPDGWQQLVFVAHADTKPEHGLLVSVDYEDILENQLQVSHAKALKIARALWNKGYRLGSDFKRVSVYRDCVSACQDRQLGNDLVRLMRSNSDGNKHP